MAEVVYVLCALTSAICAILLWRGYRSNGTKLLFWSSLCFVGFAFNNAILFIDLVLLPTACDLSLVRGTTALLGVMVLIFGLVWESR